MTLVARQRSLERRASPSRRIGRLRIHRRRLGRSLPTLAARSVEEGGAGQDVSSELLEGRRHRRARRPRAPMRTPTIGCSKARRVWRQARRPAERVAAALDDELAARDGRARRSRRTRRECRTAARHGRARARARSARGTRCSRARRARIPARSGTFGDAAARLPVHRRWASTSSTCRRSIRSAAASARGRTTRSTRGPGDPGSPWAIGSAEGGHTAVEPGPRHARRFRSRSCRGASGSGSRSRSTSRSSARPITRTCASIPSGSGIVPTARSSTRRIRRRSTRTSIRSISRRDDWQALWQELLDVSRSGSAHGVRIFRVDNPHTKPFAFWEWAIGEVSATHPDVIFLSEAFTRPKVMRLSRQARLHAVYTYFTWRNIEERADRVLHRADARPTSREYFRAELFANTPDILHAIPAARRPRRRSRCASCSRRRWAPATASTAASSSCEARALRAAARSTRLREVPDPRLATGCSSAQHLDLADHLARRLVQGSACALSASTSSRRSIA